MRMVGFKLYKCLLYAFCTIIIMSTFGLLWFLIAASINAENLHFPKDFKFGVASASYQIEGAWNTSGKGENIWDRLTHLHPDYIADHSTGDVACDSYNNFREDIDAIKAIGGDFYRFSISWSRLLPRGFANRINPDGVNYYNAVINYLLENNIEPKVTLYHWDLPQALQDIGGWPNEELAVYFEDYADVAFRLFGDRVKTWITFNEPSMVCVAYAGNGNAPRISLSGIADYLCGRTLLNAHARAYRLYERVYKEKQNGEVGISVSSDWQEPKTNSALDKNAAERALQMSLGWWMHPIASKTGDYPEIMKKRIDKMSNVEGYPKSRLPKLTAAEVESIRGTYDFIGLNHYTTRLVSEFEYPLDAPTSSGKDTGGKEEVDPKWKTSTAATWLYVVPWGFRKLLKWIKDEYGNPVLYVTENGYGDEGHLNDTDRIDYLKDYLGELLKAINVDKCNVKAYTVWSIIDNMEWTDGYTIKFGLFHVNFTDPQRARTPKESSKYYRQVIKTRRN